MSIYDDPFFQDKYQAAKEIVKVDGYSTGNLQRKLGIGYTFALRLIDGIKEDEALNAREKGRQ